MNKSTRFVIESAIRQTEVDLNLAQQDLTKSQGAVTKNTIRVSDLLVRLGQLKEDLPEAGDN